MALPMALPMALSMALPVALSPAPHTGLGYHRIYSKQKLQVSAQKMKRTKLMTKYCDKMDTRVLPVGQLW